MRELEEEEDTMTSQYLRHPSIQQRSAWKNEWLAGFLAKEKVRGAACERRSCEMCVVHRGADGGTYMSVQSPLSNKQATLSCAVL